MNSGAFEIPILARRIIFILLVTLIVGLPLAGLWRAIQRGQSQVLATPTWPAATRPPILVGGVLPLTGEQLAPTAALLGTPLPAPTSAAQNCTYPPSYWVRHPEAWPVENLLIGSTSYTRDEVLTALQSPDTQPKALLLKQFLAAALNILNGTDPGSIQTPLTEASSWLADNLLQVSLDGTIEGQGAGLAQALQAYNQGSSGPGLCAGVTLETPVEPTATPTPTLAPPVAVYQPGLASPTSQAISGGGGNSVSSSATPPPSATPYTFPTEIPPSPTSEPVNPPTSIPNPVPTPTSAPPTYQPGPTSPPPLPTSTPQPTDTPQPTSPPAGPTQRPTHTPHPTHTPRPTDPPPPTATDLPPSSATNPPPPTATNPPQPTPTTAPQPTPTSPPGDGQPTPKPTKTPKN